jgi:hypothetical protein
VRYGSIPGLGDPVSRLVMGSVAFSTMPYQEVAPLLDVFRAVADVPFL